MRLVVIEVRGREAKDPTSPSMVAVALSFVHPVPDHLGSASGNEVIAATRASAFGAWAGFNSLAVV